MCTVTFVPLEKNGFVLTSNRDEKTLRPAAQFPQKKVIGEKNIIYPLDPQGNGTWIAFSSDGTVVCLLNGGFEPHIPNPPYRHSRGLVVLDFFEFDTVQSFISNYDFEGLEPFTLVVVIAQELFELRWDGNLTSILECDRGLPHIWSSATLYAPEVIRKRKLWFENWLTQQKVSGQNHSTKIIDFHRFGGEGDKANTITMERQNFIKTVSISSVLFNDEGFVRFHYIDLINNVENKIYLSPEYA